jgi:hypothetical protein
MIPKALPKGKAAVQRPTIRERILSGKRAEIMAVPPGAYPASPTPIAVRAIKSWGKLLAKAQATVAPLQKSAMRPMHFFRLHRSMTTEVGTDRTTMDQ